MIGKKPPNVGGLLQKVSYLLVSQSKQMLVILFVEYCFPHTVQVVCRSRSFLTSSPFGEQQLEVKLDGKTIARLLQSGAQAEQ
jgi:hypothetical protein